MNPTQIGSVAISKQSSFGHQNKKNIDTFCSPPSFSLPLFISPTFQLKSLNNTSPRCPLPPPTCHSDRQTLILTPSLHQQWRLPPNHHITTPTTTLTFLHQFRLTCLHSLLLNFTLFLFYQTTPFYHLHLLQ